MEKFTPLAKILHCCRHWRHGQIPPLQFIPILRLTLLSSESGLGHRNEICLKHEPWEGGPGGGGGEGEDKLCLRHGLREWGGSEDKWVEGDKWGRHVEVVGGGQPEEERQFRDGHRQRHLHHRLLQGAQGEDTFDRKWFSIVNFFYVFRFFQVRTKASTLSTAPLTGEVILWVFVCPLFIVWKA